jgi:WD repeat-containing protein 22
LANRKEFEDDDDEWNPIEGQVGYVTSATDRKMYVPVNLDRPAFRLGGHQSIVNTAKWHPEMPRIVTCGIESKVVLHDHSRVLEDSEEVKPDTVRKRLRGGRWTSPTRVTTKEFTDEADESISDRDDKSIIIHFDE